jgi:hypothetical protein
MTEDAKETDTRALEDQNPLPVAHESTSVVDQMARKSRTTAEKQEPKGTKRRT